MDPKPDEKVCSKCKVVKATSEFHLNKRDGLYSWCKKCKSETDRARNVTPEGRAYSRQRGLRYRYGITPDDWDGLLREQGGGCKVCGASENLVVDHNHATLVLRGLLCDDCNLALGKPQDDPRRIYALADYVRFASTSFSVPPRAGRSSST